MQKEINVAIAQTSCNVADKKTNIERMKKGIKQAKEKAANIVIFPELSLTGYVCKDLTYELAEPVPGPSTRLIEKEASRNDIHIIFGMLERSTKAGAVLYNTAVLIGPDGFVGKYQKAHLPTHSVFEEKRYFRPGYAAPIFKTEIGNLGMIICYDIYFPEITRLLRLQGAQLIACISASPSVRRGFFEVLTAARAMENTVFLAFANLAGIEDGLQFWGGSRIIAPSGSIIRQAKYDEEDLIMARIDYADLERVEVFVPALRDLRPEFFNKLEKLAETL